MVNENIANLIIANATNKYFKMLSEIATEMKKYDLPIRDNLIKEFEMAALDDTSGICARKVNENGKDEFYIFINKKAAFHGGEYVDNNVRSTLCHELIHTIEGCDTHNDKFVGFAKFCDKTFGVRTLCCIESETYYNEDYKGGSHFICPVCGMEYIADDEIDGCKCQICNTKMEKIR